MDSLSFNREKSNLGGINKFSFLFEADLSGTITIIRGQVIEIGNNTDFITAILVDSSATLKEDIKDLNLYQYKFSAKIARDDYDKLQDCELLDAYRVVAIVSDNNKQQRLLGNKDSACELKFSFDKGSKVNDLNHYQIEITWLSKNRAPFVPENYTIPIVKHFEDGIVHKFEGI